MKITAQIKGINYKTFVTDDLTQIHINEFDVNAMPSVCLLNDNKSVFAVSKWVSPKRTRSYPYERVYNTLNASKKITIIPVIKDEGVDGDRDFVQWDTVSLMSLLDVFVVFAYYDDAGKNPRYRNKITNQTFNNKYVLSKIDEIKNYHSSALHWNLKELRESLSKITKTVKKSYKAIENKLNVELHNVIGIDKFTEKITHDVVEFMNFSQKKAEEAQIREVKTIQPKEILSTSTKARITILNYLGGEYFFTVDEVKFTDKDLFLIEDKYSKNSILPSKSDIKDGLLKMILYSNLSDVKVNGNKVTAKPVLSLTSAKIKGFISSKSSKIEKENFLEKNKITKNNMIFVNALFKEADKNKFLVTIKGTK